MVAIIQMHRSKIGTGKAKLILWPGLPNKFREQNWTVANDNSAVKGKEVWGHTSRILYSSSVWMAFYRLLWITLAYC